MVRTPWSGSTIVIDPDFPIGRVAFLNLDDPGRRFHRRPPDLPRRDRPPTRRTLFIRTA